MQLCSTTRPVFTRQMSSSRDKDNQEILEVTRRRRVDRPHATHKKLWYSAISEEGIKERISNWAPEKESWKVKEQESERVHDHFRATSFQCVDEDNTDLRGFRSMQTLSNMSLRNCGVLSCTTCWTLRRDFRYSRNRLRKPTKCSAVRIVPGTASERKQEQKKQSVSSNS